MERILVLGMSSDCGGIENYILNLYENINLDKIQFDFLVKEDIGKQFKERIDILGGRVYRIGTFKNDIFTVWKNLVAFYSENHYKKIYINMSYCPALIYILPALSRGLEVLYMHSHASNDIRIIKHKIFKILFMNLLLKRTNCVYLGCSEAACRWMYGDNILKNNSIHIVKNGIDYDKFSYDENKRQYIKNKFNLSNKLVIGHVGRFSIEKNHKFIIKAFEKFSNMVPDSILLLVGDGKGKTEIEKLVSECGLVDKVIFVGNVDDTSFYYNAMDCFWLPSIYEGFPIVAVEAQANGLPCIFSKEIDKEVNIMGNCVFESIDNSVIWVNLTRKIITEKMDKRKVNKDIWNKTGFDLKQQANNIEKLLLGGE